MTLGIENKKLDGKMLQRIHHDYVLPSIKHLLPGGRQFTILDVGCGTGNITNELVRLGNKAIGIDLSKDNIEIARKAFPNIQFEVYSAYDDFRSLIKEVDLVLACELIEHLQSPKVFLKNAFNVLTPGGMIIISTPYHGYLKNLFLSLCNLWDKHFTANMEGGHIKFFSHKTLSGLIKECGFKNINYRNSGRIIGLWKSMICRAEK